MMGFDEFSNMMPLTVTGVLLQPVIKKMTVLIKYKTNTKLLKRFSFLLIHFIKLKKDEQDILRQVIASDNAEFD